MAVGSAYITMVISPNALPLTQAPESYTQAMNHSQARRNLIARQRGEHCHDFAQVLFGWKGRMDCELADSAGRLLVGTAALVPASASHLYAGLNDESELIVIDVAQNDPFIQALGQACGLSIDDTLFSRANFIRLDDETMTLLAFAAKQLTRVPQRDASVVTCQMVSLFMTQLIRLYSSEPVRPLTNTRLDRARLDRLVDQRLAQPPTNGEMAECVNLSESHFIYLFRRQFGMTPQQYVMELRMRRAQFLLLNSHIPLAAVADEVGFSDASSFCRAYRRRFQETPGATRRSLN